MAHDTAMASDEVHVWSIDASVAAPVHGDLATLLDDDERGRAAALLNEVDRRRFTAAHGASRVIIGRSLDVPPERLRWRRGRHGKPELTGAVTGVRVNLSRSGDLALLAITGVRAVGVDVQAWPDAREAVRLAARFFPPAESRFVTAGDGDERADRFAVLWSRKEACVKAAGARLVQGLALTVHATEPDDAMLMGDRVSNDGAPDEGIPHGETRRRGISGGAAVRFNHDSYTVHDVPVPRRFRAAVALAGAREFRVLHHHWSP